MATNQTIETVKDMIPTLAVYRFLPLNMTCLQCPIPI